ncbi:DegQ family serine endoprotease [Marinicauda algicola]|uniref:DegQ family serine endoprotease n=1 Tax=Marinicauda algicola TaxID=2029849 RepID=A0A4S2H2X1_9PROT|nr:DegQ family serine endoprotease [Marinicauda algicola]TGY89833.1 DegQ family serine endoprotease [Marinicauda algicola]
MARTLLAALSLALGLAATACAQEEPQALDGAPEQSFHADRAVPDSRADMQLSFAPIVREAAPAVVNVYSRRVVAQRSPFAGDPFFERFFGPQTRQREVGSLGSGVIVDPSGIIVTNHHVVEGAQELRVVLADRREFDAELLLADERTDLAVLRIDAGEALPVLPYDEAGDAEVGDLVLAIGNPFGVGQTVTSGIVSALARTDVGISDYSFFIQTDAAVNPGNSGGALVDMDGELIGVNTAIFSRSGGSHGIGFAIPADMVRTVVEAALSGEELIRPWLGARLQPVTSDLAQSLGLDRPRGAIVSELWPGGPAEEAGLRRGDIIVEVDGVEVNDETGIRFRFATHSLGDEAEVTVLRDGERRTLPVQARPAPGERDAEPVRVRGRNPLQGAQVVELSPALNERLGIDTFLEGIMVTGVERRSAAAYYGFQPGDRVLEIQGEAIETLDDLDRVLERYDNDAHWPVEIVRGGERFARTLRL